MLQILTILPRERVHGRSRWSTERVEDGRAGPGGGGRADVIVSRAKERRHLRRTGEQTELHDTHSGGPG